ncbi:MAG: hypothetical protein LAT57_13810 [Balneolales bacterium]|nr:hypothetical protein [Balneolales bacterium]
MKHLLLISLIWAASVLTATAQLRPVGEPVLLYDDITLSLQNPIPSPDSRTIALTGSNFSGIWLMDANGDNLRQITDENHIGFGFKWSADASTIIARSTQRENQRRSYAIKSFDLISNESTYLTEYQAHMPTVPFFEANQQNVMVATSEEVQTISFQLSRALPSEVNLRPTAHANGNKLFFSSPTSSTLAEFTPFGSDVSYLNASASPDGSKIAFEVYGGNLHILEIESGTLTDLGPGYKPTWSPDSQYISFTRNTDDGYVFTSGEIVAASADGLDSVVLFSSENTIPGNPHWDFNQNRIYFDYIDSGSILYIDVATE